MLRLTLAIVALFGAQYKAEEAPAAPLDPVPEENKAAEETPVDAVAGEEPIPEDEV